MTVADEASPPTPAPCPCGVGDPPPWRGHDLPWSPASVVAGVLLLAVAVGAGLAGRQPWVAPVLAGAYVLGTVLAAVAVSRRGHRGGCRLGRAAWIGLAAFGLPLRVVAGLAV